MKSIWRAPIRLTLTLSLLVAATSGTPCVAQGFTDDDANLEKLPQVPPGFHIELVASEPLVRNPCSLAFDERGRLFVGMGPQYRNPRPDTPGDSVMVLSDADGDGRFDQRKEFATGLNCIQGMAWHGVKTSDIAKRATQRISPMPVFADLFDAQQVADLTAWLLKREAESTAANTPLDPETAKFAIESKSDRLNVTLNGKAFGSYLFAHNELTRPAWIGIHSHTGVPVTRDFPATGDDVDHRYMHPGIWISFGHLNGQDYWRMQSRTRHERFLEEPRADGNRTSFVALNSYLSSDGQSIMCRENVRYTLLARADGVLMRVESRFENPAADFYFGDQEESGLAFRMAPELSVEGGTGRILNHHGDRNGDRVWGKQTKWIDYSGTVGGRHVGIFVRPHVLNARDCWMHARDYGVVACNPFPRQPEERREPYVKTWVRKGEVYRLGYDVLIHDTRNEFDPQTVAIPPD